MASRTFPRNQHLPFWPPQIDPPMKTLTAIPVSLLLLFTLGQNLLAQPSLSRMTPGAVTAGQTVEVTLSGDKLDWPLQAWASFPGKLELVAPKDSKQNKSIQ